MTEYVFISYSTKYAEQVDRLKQFLQGRGIAIWIDHEQLQAGTPDWGKAIEQGIRSSKAMIYAASPEAKDSSYVGHELALAKEKYKIPICPYWIAGNDWLDAAPFGWARTQYIDARRNSEQSTNALLQWLSQYVHVAIAGSTTSAPAQPVVSSPQRQNPVQIPVSPHLPESLRAKGFVLQFQGGVEVIIPSMKAIPARAFLMGSDKKKDSQANDNELQQFTFSSGEYSIGTYPLSVAEYACFMRATKRNPPQEDSYSHTSWEKQQQKSDHPVVNVGWKDVLAYVQWLAQVTNQPYRLPTEAEWEKAARGTDGRIYPWGNEWDKTRANTIDGGPGGTTPVGSYPQGASPYGCLDMSGNVWEWTSTIYIEKYPYKYDKKHEDLNSANSRVMHGGSWNYDPWFARAAYRNYSGFDYFGSGWGGRLVRDVLAAGS